MNSQKSFKNPEILAPVGDAQMLLAAVHGGADAVYIGAPGFNARGRSPEWSMEELQHAIHYCRLFGVKIFIACNVLVFQRELPSIVQLLKRLIQTGPDALIIQDLGLAKIIHHAAPEMTIHASTQMTISSAEAIQCVTDLGIRRFVLAREMSMEEIAEVRKKSLAELEVFTHGALCVAYSGQCLTSENFGGRSANRGQCAQACRLPYQIVVDGEKKLDSGYYVSPQDLFGIDDVQQLKHMGLDSFKIEGRLKSPAYVAQTCRSFKNALEGRPFSGEDLTALYSRGKYNGWLNGVNHQKLVDPFFSSHTGVELGKISEIGKGFVTICIDKGADANPGDGLLFLENGGAKELGSRIYKIDKHEDGAVQVRLDPGFDVSRLSPGTRVFRNDTPSLEAEVSRVWRDVSLHKKIPVIVKLSGKTGEPLCLQITDADGHYVKKKSPAKLDPTRSHLWMEQNIRQELSAMGRSPFRMADCEIDLAREAFVNNRMIRKLRQQCIEELSAIRARVNPPDFNQDKALELISLPGNCPNPAKLNRVHVLIRELAQLEALEGIDIDTVYFDFEYGREYKEAVDITRRMGFKAGIATTRIFKPREQGHLRRILTLRPDVVLVRNLGALQILKDSGLELIGDFSLNACNHVTVEYLLSKNLSRICPGYDLNSTQLLDLAEALPGRPLEITLHQHIPAFHMEHCVFAAFLSKGTSWRDCGKPCDKHKVELFDPKGVGHPLKADAECRNTMFHGEAQSAVNLYQSLRSLGIADFRIEALFESPAELKDLVDGYLQVMHGKMSSTSFLNRVNVSGKYGVTEGQLFQDQEYLDRKKTGNMQDWMENDPYLSSLNNLNK